MANFNGQGLSVGSPKFLLQTLDKAKVDLVTKRVIKEYLQKCLMKQQAGRAEVITDLSKLLEKFKTCFVHLTFPENFELETT